MLCYLYGPGAGCTSLGSLVIMHVFTKSGFTLIEAKRCTTSYCVALSSYLVFTPNPKQVSMVAVDDKKMNLQNTKIYNYEGALCLTVMRMDVLSITSLFTTVC